jgi:flagellar biosynthesis component FlhA
LLLTFRKISLLLYLWWKKKKEEEKKEEKKEEKEEEEKKGKEEEKKKDEEEEEEKKKFSLFFAYPARFPSTTLKKEASCSSETLITLYQSTRCHITEKSKLKEWCCENHKHHFHLTYTPPRFITFLSSHDS